MTNPLPEFYCAGMISLSLAFRKGFQTRISGSGRAGTAILFLLWIVVGAFQSRAATEPVPAALLDRNPHNGLACREVCYVFGADVAPPFRFVVTTTSPDQVRLDPTKLTERNVVSNDPINGNFSEARLGNSKKSVVIDYTCPDLIPAGTEVCFTLTEDFFVGQAIPPNLQLDIQPKRLSDGFNPDLLGNVFIRPFPNKFGVTPVGKPLGIHKDGGPNQIAGKLQIVNENGDPIPVANDLNISGSNNNLTVTQNPDNRTQLDVTVPSNPATVEDQNKAIDDGGFYSDAFGITLKDENGQTKEFVVNISVPVANPLPESNFNGTPRSDSQSTNSGSLNKIFEQLSAGDPVSMATGAFFFTETLVDLGGPLPLRFELAYGSDTFPHENGVALPEKFEQNHRAMVSAGAGGDAEAFITLGMGREVVFKRTAFGPWLLVESEAVTQTLAETGGHYLLVDPSTNLVRIFKKTPIQNNNILAHLVAVRDRIGNTLTYTFDPAADPRENGPISVSDGLGRELRFIYTPLGVQNQKFLSRVEDHTGRHWTFHYDLNPVDNAGGAEVTLRSITDPMSGVVTYTYTGENRLAAIQKPVGNTPYSQTYGTDIEANAVATQTDALGRTTTFSRQQGVPGFGLTQRTLINPDGTLERYFHNADGSLMSAQTDAEGNTMRFEQDGTIQRVKKTIDRDGAASEIGYNPINGTISSFKNARGENTSFNQIPPPAFQIQNPDNGELVAIGQTFADLRQIVFPDFTFRTYQRNVLTGLATRITDRANDRVEFTHDFLGNILTQTNGEGGISTFTYDGAGNLATSTDDDTGTTTYEYDALNRLTEITRPDASAVSFTYDALDRLLTRTDERGTVTKFDYDANSNLTTITRDFGGALAQTTAFEYDVLDRLVKVTDPDTNQTLLNYPYHGKPERITLPDGSTIQFEYDARRSLAATIDQVGARTDFENDPAEQVRKITSPEKRTLTLERDDLGAITARIDHTGDRSSAELDVNSRLLSTTDPIGRKMNIVRDGEGRVTRRTEPVSGDTTYLYDDNGRLTRLTDVRGKQWNLTYTAMGRLDTVTDPNGKVWDYDYDTRGRLSQITHPDTVVETRVYDAESHQTARNFSDGLSLTMAFDALDRVTTQSKAEETAALQIAYDTRNNLTQTTLHGQTFSATHDILNRLATLDYAGQMTVTYTYDDRGLVTRVTDSLTGAQVDIEYNLDRQMKKTSRNNGVVTDYSYDAEGKIAQIQHGTLGTIDFTFNAANEPTAIADTAFPVDGASALTTASTETQTFDDASQLTSGGYAYDERGRPTTDGTRAFTWDSAERLAHVVNGGSTVAYEYTAGGVLAERTLNGQTTQFGYSYSVATRPILAERKSGAFTRFYVALPDGRLLYQIELNPSPSVRFYHFGKVGETRFLTDAAGAVADAYAYDGYGRLLARTGTSDQIYGFVGELGVRDDPAAGLIHMRARHYDPQSGRFLSRDPIFLALMGRNSQNANPYHYVEGMPTWVTDPSGLESIDEDFFGNLGELVVINIIRDIAEENELTHEAAVIRFLAPLSVVRILGIDGELVSGLRDHFLEIDFVDLQRSSDARSREAEVANQLMRDSVNRAAAKALIRAAAGQFFRFFNVTPQALSSGSSTTTEENAPSDQDDENERLRKEFAESQRQYYKDQYLRAQRNAR